MSKRPRMTIHTLRVLALLLDSREGLSGADIYNATRIFSGTLYPILYRLEGIGWLKGAWEDVDPEVVGRPQRKFYDLTTVGRAQAKAALAAYSNQIKGAASPGWVPSLVRRS